MDKKTKKASLFLLLFVVLVISLSAVSATSSNSSQWPQQANNNQNTGQSPYLGPQDNTTKWNHTFSENDSIASGPVVGRDGTVYIGTNYHPHLNIEINNGPKSAGTLRAFNRDGSVKWTYTLSDGISNYIHGTPTIGPDGTIYLVTRFYDGTDNFGNLYAIKDGGSSAIYKWNFSIPGNSTQITGSPIIGQDGTIYFGTQFYIQDEHFSRWIGNFYALNPNGTLKWNYSLPEGYNSNILNTAALGSDGTIYFNVEYSDRYGPQTQAGLYALKDMGTYASKKWLAELNEGFYNSIEGYPVIGSDGTIYVGYNAWIPVSPYSWSSLYAFIDNGTSATEKWIYTLSDDSRITSSPTIAKDGTIYFGANEEGVYNLYAIQDLGTSANKKWNFTTHGGIRFAPIIGNDGTIYFGDGMIPDTFFALDNLGKIKWSYHGSPVTEAAMAQDGTLYFVLGEDHPQLGLLSESEIMPSTATLIAIKGPPANLYVKTSVDNPNPDIGDIVTVTFKVGNDGPNTAYNTILTYTIPQGMKFIKAWADVGTISYNPITRILTWDMGDVPVGDPIAHIQMLAQKAGKFPVDPEISTSSDDPNLSSRIENAEITVQAVENNKSHENDTIGMQHTGLPLATLVLAILMVIGGSMIPKKKR